MKAISFSSVNLRGNPDSVYKRNKQYRVSLGNECVREFSSKRLAVAFANKCAKELTVLTLELNELYAACVMEYRRAWYYADHNRQTKRVKRPELKKTMHTLMSNCEDAFDRIFVTPEPTYNCFFQFNRISNLLLAGFLEMEELYSIKGFAYEKARISTCISRINDVVNTANKIGFPKKRTPSPSPPIGKNSEFRYTRAQTARE